MSVSAQIRDILTQNLAPLSLKIKDESHKHEGHAGHDRRGESHFRIEIVSAAFDGKTRPERHRIVYSLLEEQIKNRIHALSILALSPSEQE
jgi:BolA protein